MLPFEADVIQCDFNMMFIHVATCISLDILTTWCWCSMKVIVMRCIDDYVCDRPRMTTFVIGLVFKPAFFHVV